MKFDAHYICGVIEIVYKDFKTFWSKLKTRLNCCLAVDENWEFFPKISTALLVLQR